LRGEEPTGGDGGQAAKRSDEPLAVERHRNGPPHPNVLERLVLLDVEREVVPEVVRLQDELSTLVERVPELDDEVERRALLHHVEFAALDLQGSEARVDADRRLHAVEVRACRVPILRKALQR